MFRIFTLICVLIGHYPVFSQALFINNGADIHIMDGAFVIVKTNSLQNIQTSGVGTMNNSGTVVIEGNLVNDGVIVANGDTIRLTGNWVNNDTYTANNSWVELVGGTQQITGTSVTTFNHLNLLGGNSIKRQTLNAEVSGTLLLNDAELATDVNEMLITNPGIFSVTRNNGFVSSIGNGRLSRQTNSSATYLFPVGTPSYNNPPSIFRPVEFNPSNNTANIYGGMVIKGNATNDGYNVNTLDETLCKVNPAFYHKLYHTTGVTPVELKMFFDPSTDGDWTDQAHWDSPDRWNYSGPSTAGNSLGFSTVSVNSVSDFVPEPFALARKNFVVAAGPDVSISQGQSTVFNPVIGTPFVSNIQWTPELSLSCTNCENPSASPSATTTYTLSVTDAEGCVASDNLVVTVTQPELLIPTAFSPNGDGMNDFFRILNSRVSKYNMQVYNRWGEKVFETSDPREGWDGVFQGLEQELGVYVWHCSYQLEGRSQTETAKGNVTLIR